jgi:hypothetical protein
VKLPSKEKTREVVGLVLVVWGVALFCLAALDWIGYRRFFVELLLGGSGP